MNLLDIVIITVLGIFALKGFTRGLINEIASLFSIIAGSFIAYRLAPVAATLISASLHIPHQIALFISFLILMALIGFAAHIAGNLVTTALKLVMLGGINRIGGIGIGIAEGVLILSLLFSAAMSDFMPSSLKNKVQNSENARFFSETGTRLLSYWNGSNGKTTL